MGAAAVLKCILCRLACAMVAGATLVSRGGCVCGGGGCAAAVVQDAGGGWKLQRVAAQGCEHTGTAICTVVFLLPLVLRNSCHQPAVRCSAVGDFVACLRGKVLMVAGCWWLWGPDGAVQPR